MTSKSGVPLEHDEQVAFFTQVSYEYRNKDDFVPNLLFAVPNGSWFGGNGYAVYNRMKAEGVRKGVADILYLQPRGKWPYLAIEMKRSDKRNVRNGGLEPEQIEFMDAVIRAGGRHEICYTAEEALGIFWEYMELPCLR